MDRDMLAQILMQAAMRGGTPSMPGTMPPMPMLPTQQPGPSAQGFPLEGRRRMPNIPAVGPAPPSTEWQPYGGTF